MKQTTVEDSILRWSERHGRQIQPSKGRVTKSQRLLLPRPKALAKARVTLKGLAKKTPQVMLKVTGGGRSMASIRAHFKYLTKHGEVQLENQNGEQITDAWAVEEELRMWRLGGYGIRDTEKRPSDLQPEEKLQPREAVNIVLSMAAGTDPEGVRRAAKEFARENFGERHEYVFGLHTDRGHPHVHICVKSRSFVDFKRLDTRKGQLQAWRESFAEKLYQEGIQAAATPRATRNTLSYQKTFHGKEMDTFWREPAAQREPTVQMKAVARQEQRQLSDVVHALSLSELESDRDIARIFRSGEVPFFDPQEHEKEQHAKQLRKANEYQLQAAQDPRGAPIQSISLLPTVSDIPVVQRMRAPEVPLKPDVPDRAEPAPPNAAPEVVAVVREAPEQQAPAEMQRQAQKQGFKDAFSMDEVPAVLIASLVKQYGELAKIVPAKYPADKDAKTATGNELRTNYKGYVVDVSPDYIAQRVDSGRAATSIVLHERKSLSVPPNQRTGEMPPLDRRLRDGLVEKFDLSVSYGASGKARVYDRDRVMEEIQFEQAALAKHSGLDGAKQAAYEKNLAAAVENFREAHYEQLRERADAYARLEKERQDIEQAKIQEKQGRGR